ncbi:MAG TPA: hemerythrin domain-containing protein [Burkholderiaceae bacterium]
MSTTALRAPTAQDALELLSDEQDQILELFDRYGALVAEAAQAEERRELAQQICSLLLVHVQAKRDVLYPAARQALDDETPIDETLESQAVLEETIADVQGGDATEPRYDAGVRMLQEQFVDSMEQERTALFPALRASSLDLEELGGELGALEERLLDADDDLGAA